MLNDFQTLYFLCISMKQAFCVEPEEKDQKFSSE